MATCLNTHGSRMVCNRADATGSNLCHDMHISNRTTPKSLFRLLCLFPFALAIVIRQIFFVGCVFALVKNVSVFAVAFRKLLSLHSRQRHMPLFHAHTSTHMQTWTIARLLYVFHTFRSSHKFNLVGFGFYSFLSYFQTFSAFN